MRQVGCGEPLTDLELAMIEVWLKKHKVTVIKNKELDDGQTICRMES